ncbi:hypothetical protein [Marinobacter sp.]|uniref:hypothetical protein n=1 Tax=Marinobacter sp. TaxID=50741 RepID=UPI0034A14420
MSTIKVHAGDFLPKEGFLKGTFINLKTEDRSWVGENVQLADIETLELATEESVKKLGGTVGWGAVGGLLLGPVGLLAGLVAGGRKKEVTFIAKFKDGRKVLATTDNKTYTQMQAAVF